MKASIDTLTIRGREKDTALLHLVQADIIAAGNVSNLKMEHHDADIAIESTLGA